MIPANELIYYQGDTCITVNKQATAAAMSLLERTIYGTLGPKYQHTGQAKKIQHLTEPYFFNLEIAGQVVGTYCLSGRYVGVPCGNLKSYYGRYFAVDPAFTGRGYGSLLKREAIRYIEYNSLKPYLFYSYIEETNHRSMNISMKDGYSTIGTLETVLFSRLYPQLAPRMERLAEDELPAMLTRLQKIYQDYTLVQFDQVYYQQNYFVLKEQGKILAGVQANPVFWRIVDMPGVSGKLVTHLLPHLPIIHRLVNPAKHRFAALEAIYVQQGQEEALVCLLEGVLAHLGVTSALWMVDVNDPLGSRMKATGKLGMLNRLQKRIYTRVMAHYQGITPKDVKDTPQQPIYVSAFDCT